MITKAVFAIFECSLMWLFCVIVLDRNIPFTHVPEVETRIKEDTIYADIINHCQNPTLEIIDRITCAHETTHMINAEMRNNLQKKAFQINKKGKKINAFYLPKGNSFVIEEPDMTKAKVAEFVPEELKWKRYHTYITKARAWNDRPLYLVDEWCAYINGALVAVEDSINNRHSDGWSDAVSGPLEFSVYCVAMCMAIEKYDQAYWIHNDNLRKFMKWNLERSFNTYEMGKDYKYFKWDQQEKFLNKLRTSDTQDVVAMRDFIHKHFNGIWLNEQ